MSSTPNLTAQETVLTPLRALVPMAHVADVERSIDFYRQIGFAVRHRLEHNGRLQWAWIDSGEAHLMLVRSDRALNPDAQDVLFLFVCRRCGRLSRAVGRARGQGKFFKSSSSHAGGRIQDR